MPLSVVGNNFQHVWDERSYFKLQSLTKQMLAENEVSPADCMSAFKSYDRDGDGLIDRAEFDFFVTSVLGLQLNKPELNKLWSMVDSARTTRSMRKAERPLPPTDLPPTDAAAMLSGAAGAVATLLATTTVSLICLIMILMASTAMAIMTMIWIKMMKLYKRMRGGST